MSHFLLKAASAGDVAKVTALLDGGVHVDYHSKDRQGTGRTALSEAAIGGRGDVVRLLLERGAEVDWKDRAVGFTPLGWAADQGHEAVAKLLLDAGANPNAATPDFLRTPLMAAAQRGSLPIVKLLIAAGADVSAATGDGRTALSIAQERKQPEVAAFLSEIGASLHTTVFAVVAIPWPALDAAAEFRDYTSPEKVLRGFILAMHAWESSAAKRAAKRESAALDRQILAEMQHIFDLYCTPIKRPHGRLGSYQTPPEYQPTETLLAVNFPKPGKAELVTIAGADTPDTEYLYVALKKKGRWLIDNKKYRLAGTKTWNKWTL